MKKLLIILAVVLFGCNDDITITKAEYEKILTNRVSEYPKPLELSIHDEYHEITRIQVILIDSCEYIYGSTQNYYGGIFLTHKGNCKFCNKRKN